MRDLKSKSWHQNLVHIDCSSVGIVLNHLYALCTMRFVVIRIFDFFCLNHRSIFHSHHRRILFHNQFLDSMDFYTISVRLFNLPCSQTPSSQYQLFLPFESIFHLRCSIYFFWVIPDRLCFQPSFILSSSNAMPVTVSKCPFFPSFFRLFVMNLWWDI